MNKIIENMDWDLLGKQKHQLISMIDVLPPDHILWGVVHLIDAIQDEAVDSGAATEEQGSCRFATEEEVFNLKEE